MKTVFLPSSPPPSCRPVSLSTNFFFSSSSLSLLFLSPHPYTAIQIHVKKLATPSPSSFFVIVSPSLTAVTFFPSYLLFSSLFQNRKKKRCRVVPVFFFFKKIIVSSFSRSRSNSYSAPVRHRLGDPTI